MTHKFINRSIQPKHNGRPTAQALHGYSYINVKYSWKMCLLLLNSFFFFRKIKNDSFGRCLSFSSLLSSLPCDSCIHITYLLCARRVLLFCLPECPKVCAMCWHVRSYSNNNNNRYSIAIVTGFISRWNGTRLKHAHCIRKSLPVHRFSGRQLERNCFQQAADINK